MDPDDRVKLVWGQLEDKQKRQYGLARLVLCILTCAERSVAELLKQQADKEVKPDQRAEPAVVPPTSRPHPTSPGGSCSR